MSSPLYRAGPAAALVCVFLTGAAWAGQSPTVPPPAPQSLRVKVVRSFAHDPRAYTEGLVFQAGRLYESSGIAGHSSVRRVDPATGEVEVEVALERTLFGEGLAAVDGHLIQLTLGTGRALVWTLPDLEPRGELRFPGEGWGLCFDGASLVTSDGSARLVRRDPRTLEPVGTLAVRDTAGAVRSLNELECVGKTIYANVWKSARIARIDGETGEVTAWIDAAGLPAGADGRPLDGLNGIAHLPSSGRFVLTGKLWPRAFEVEFVAPRQADRR